MMRPAIPILILLALSAGLAVAKLPAPNEAAKAQTAEAASKSAWTAKVDAYKLCQSIDKTAAYYRAHPPAGKPVPAAMETPPCVDPGPYVSQVTPQEAKPLEASGAHSPPGKADSPPSTKATAAEIAGGVKKP